MAVLLSSVIESTVAEMTGRGFPAGYVKAMEKELERFREWNLAKGREYFSEEDCEEYCQEEFGTSLNEPKSTKISSTKSKRRVAIRRLAEMGLNGSIDYYLARCRQPFYGRYENLFNGYVSWMEENRYAPSTIMAKRGYLYDFCRYVENEGLILTEISEVCLETFFTLLNKPLASLHAYRKAVRCFLLHMYEEGITEKDLSLYVREDNYQKTKECLPTVVSIDDVRESISRINRMTVIGKRDYAIVLLTAELGIRPGDVALLRIDAFDWDMKTICYRQEKTKVLVTQPLTPSVGNAVIDYLMNGRANSTVPVLFLSKDKKGPMARNTVATIVKRHMKGCIPICGDKEPSARVLRATLASELIRGNSELPVVSAVLGHTTINTARHYVAVDFEGLKKCALPIPPVKSPLYQYTDKGGLQ